MALLLWAPLLHKLQDMSRNRALFISEVRITVRLLLLTSHIGQNRWHLFCFEAHKDIPQVNYGTKPTTCCNDGACSQ